MPMDVPSFALYPIHLRIFPLFPSHTNRWFAHKNTASESNDYGGSDGILPLCNEISRNINHWLVQGWHATRGRTGSNATLPHWTRRQPQHRSDNDERFGRIRVPCQQHRGRISICQSIPQHTM